MQQRVDGSLRPENFERQSDPASTRKDAVRRLAHHCGQYRGASTRKAVTQIVTTAVPFVVLLAAMLWFVDRAYVVTLLLAVPLGGLIVRFFILQHDCGHGSFLPSATANQILGRVFSVLTLTPYGLWQRVHALHHATSGNLSRRGAGDIDTLTVREYLALLPMARMRYRVYRHPLFLFLIGVPAFFLLIQRLPWGHPLPVRETWQSVLGLDLAIAIVYGGLGLLIGFKTLVLTAVPAIVVASAVGGWLFFIQHQFEDTHWDTSEAWDFQLSAVHGSSFYVLNPVLNWFTGHIGLHHIHHLSSLIPNYRLRDCLEATPEFKTLNRLSLLESFKCARLSLWDEERRRLIGFSELKSIS